MKILILEDEIPAFEKLHNYLDSYFNKTWEYDWGKTIVDGKQYLTQYAYDLIFADIGLLDDNVFTLFNAIEIDAPIIFCSAYNQYLLNAFAFKVAIVEKNIKKHKAKASIEFLYDIRFSVYFKHINS